MSLKTVLKSIGHAVTGLFSAKNLTAGEAFVAKYLPEFGADLASFSAKLPAEFASLEKLAEEAVSLFKEAKGTTISKSLAVALSQAAFNAAWPKIEAEAVKLLK